MVSSGATMPARAPASIDMLQIVMRPSIDSARMALPAVLEHVALAAAGADLRDDREDDVLRGDAGPERALDVDRHRLERLQRQGLGGEHVLDLARADAERHRAERAVRRGVRVAADDRDAGLRESQLRSDDVHDALLDVAERVQADAELLRVAPEGLDLGAAREVGDRPVDRERRGVVVLGRDGEVGPAHRASGHPEAVEGLRAGDLVHEVEVDVDEVGRAVLALLDQVVVPDLLGQGARSRLRRARAVDG